MAKELKALAAAMMLAVLHPVMADQACYLADQESGELRFSGVAEGTPFRGQFREFAVRLCLEGEDLATATIEVTVQTGSSDVGNRDGNQALREQEFFAIEQFPEASWRSSAIVAGDDGYEAEGELAIKSISAPQAVRLELATGSEPWVLSGGAEIMRLDWEVGIGEFEDTDFIRERVDLRFNLKLQPEH
jgi:polyisoprenoid-binding protein YceI